MKNGEGLVSIITSVGGGADIQICNKWTPKVSFLAVKVSSFDHANICGRALEWSSALFFAVGPLVNVNLASTLCPPDVTHVMNEIRPSPLFAVFRFVYYTECKRWERPGNEATPHLLVQFTCLMSPPTGPRFCRLPAGDLDSHPSSAAFLPHRCTAGIWCKYHFMPVSQWGNEKCVMKLDSTCRLMPL